MRPSPSVSASGIPQPHRPGINLRGVIRAVIVAVRRPVAIGIGVRHAAAQWAGDQLVVIGLARVNRVPHLA